MRRTHTRTPHRCSARSASAERDRRGREPHVDPGPVAAAAVGPQQRADRLLQGNGRGERRVRLGGRAVPGRERHVVHAGRPQTVDRVQDLGAGRHVRRRRPVVLSDHDSHPRRR